MERKEEITRALDENGWVGVMCPEKYIHYEVDMNDPLQVYKFVFTTCDEDDKIDKNVWYGFHEYEKVLMFAMDVCSDIIDQYAGAGNTVVLDESEYPEYPRTPLHILQMYQRIRAGLKNLRLMKRKLQLVFQKDHGHFQEGIVVQKLTKVYSVIYAAGGYTGDPVNLQLMGTYSSERTANQYAEKLKKEHKTDEIYVLGAVLDMAPA